MDAQPKLPMIPSAPTPDILYEDNHLLVAVKPPGVLSQAGELPLPDMLTLIKAYLKTRDDKPGNVFLGLVHRLDVNVGGVMVFAKTSKAASRLSEQIRKKEFEKRYLAVVQGLFRIGEEGRWTDTLKKESEKGMSRIASDGDGKEAVLTYRVVAVDSVLSRSLLDIRLETGRFHQIRMQFASRGTPLVGDAKYGYVEKTPNRQMGLWAYRLGFLHPTTGLELEFERRPEGWMFQPFESDFPLSK